MNERQVLDIIERHFRAAGLPLPEGLVRPHGDRVGVTWLRAARAIVSECDTEKRQAARAASIVGVTVTRGRTKI